MAPPSQTHLIHRLRKLSLVSPTASALFYARIWLALSPATQTHHEALHALALAFLAAKEPYSALHLVRELADDDERRIGCAGCGVIVARCCEAVGRVGEGAAVLERALKRGGGYDLPSLAGPEGISSNLMLARLSRKAKHIETATEYYQKALVDEPWLWEAFTGLCDIGQAPLPEFLFPDPPPAATSSRPASVRASRPPTLSPNPMPRSSTSEMPFLPKRAQLSPLGPGPAAGAGGGFFTPDVGGTGFGGRMGGMGGMNTWDTPSIMGDTTFPTIPVSHLPLPAPNRKPLPSLISAASSLIPASLRPSYTSTQTPISADTSSTTQLKPPGMKRPRGQTSRTHHTPSESPYHHIARLPAGSGQTEAEIRRSQRDLKSIEPNGETDAPVRRSSRLKTTTVPSKKLPKDISGLGRDKVRTTRSRSTTSSASGATATTTTEHHSSPSQDTQLQSHADDWLRDIVRRCARAYRFLSLYKCQEAIREIDTLPTDFQNSAFALSIYARASYELANYIPALRAFTSLHTLEPYNLESTHLHSTLLWHLADSPALSALAQELVAVDRERPEPWIAAGNCFSLEKDHDEAMRCFRRATQVDPGCAYAWTLCGYEAVEMEEYERAIGFYRSAIRSDQRHYNAWYGMGAVYLKMGKVRHAEHHYRRAAEINPTNAILLSCIGTVLEQQGDNRQALTYYEQACRFAPESPMVAFKRIRVLVALNQIDDAITLLEPLSRTAPDEAQVQFLLGKCYLRTNRRAEAMVALTNARELQPKLEGAVRATVAANGEEVDDEEEDE